MLLNKKMENEHSKRLSTLIEVLTHSGSTTLDEDVFKEVKKICKSSEIYVTESYNLVLKQLKKNNSQIRYLAFLICKELFTRSGLFRQNVLNDLQLIVELTTEISSKKKLPPPTTAAKNLKTLVVSTIKKWVETYGTTHKQLKVAYNYLETCGKVNFRTLEIRNSSEAVVENERERHLRAINNERLKKLIEEFHSNQSEIELTITSLSNCLSLLLPPLEDFFITDKNLQDTNLPQTNDDQNNEDSEEEINEDKSELRNYGIPFNYNLSLELQPDQIKIDITEENSSIIENAEDCVKLIIHKYFPMVKKWAKTYCKYSEGSTEEIKKIIDLKEKLENVVKKYNSLNIEGKKSVDDNDSSSDDELEEVKKEGYEDTVVFPEVESTEIYGTKVEEKTKTNSNIQAPSTSSCAEKEYLENTPSTSKECSSDLVQLERKKKLLAIAPKLPFDIDLYHWEDENLTPPTLVSTKMDVDKFWGCAESDEIHEIPNPEGIAALRTRVIEFSGKFEPVKWACRAPLPNGKLCPRKDRFKCPFHGKIVARDETGKCQNSEDEKRKTTEKNSIDFSKLDWQDPELLKDLKAATGIDLKIPEKKGKRKRDDRKNLTHKKMKTSLAALRILETKKMPGLVDVVKKQNNSYTRLYKKIFNKSSMKRVSSALNKLDKNKFQDKFRDQFNYS